MSEECPQCSVYKKELKKCQKIFDFIYERYMKDQNDAFCLKNVGMSSKDFLSLSLGERREIKKDFADYIDIFQKVLKGAIEDEVD